MDKIQKLIKDLKNKQKKVDFLKHILDSAKSYESKEFKDVKDEVVILLDKFITRAVQQIEGEAEAVTKSAEPEKQINVDLTKPANPVKKPLPKESELSIGDKFSFSSENRHLSGKKARVMKDGEPFTLGEVVGLDAPYVIVKAPTGQTIKVPRQDILD